MNYILRTVVLLIVAIPWMYQTVESPNDWRSPEALVDADMGAYCVLSEANRQTGRIAESTRAKAEWHDRVQNQVGNSINR